LHADNITIDGILMKWCTPGQGGPRAMNLPPFELDEWLNTWKFASPPPADLGSSTGPVWTFGELLALDPSGAAAVRLRETPLVYAPPDGSAELHRVDGLSQAEIWLELIADDVEAAKHRLAEAGVARRDEIEPLPRRVQGPGRFDLAATPRSVTGEQRPDAGGAVSARGHDATGGGQAPRGA
jgi:hypothetical protein